MKLMQGIILLHLLPLKSQIIIMSPKEMPPSSDESETIDVGSEISEPFRDINVADIQIEIVNDLWIPSMMSLMYK